MGVCNCSMFCCTLLYVHSSIAIILMGKRELIALLNLSFWCLVMVERLFLAVPRGCLQFVIVVFPDHTHLLILLEGGETTCYHFARSIQIVLEDYTNKLKIKNNFTLFSSKYIFTRFDFPNVGLNRKFGIGSEFPR